MSGFTCQLSKCSGESMEELAEKNFDKECLNDFSVPHYNEVRLVHYIHDKIIVHHYLHKVESLILCTNYI